MIIENQDKDLTALVLTFADNLPVTSDTITAIVRLEHDGHDDDTKFWDTNAGGSWQASPTTYPTASHIANGIWGYTLPAAATVGHCGARIVYHFTDNQTVPASTTTISGVFEHVVQGMAIDNVADLVESQRGAHTWQNNEIFYVDPVNGDTIANGNTGKRALPLDTVTEALSLVTDSSHSVIFLVSGAAAGPTTLTEAVTVNKRYTFIRGPGRDFIWTRSGAGDTISVTSDGCELSGFRLQTAATGSGSGVSISGSDFTRIHNVYAENTQGDGVTISNSDHTRIHDCFFEDAGQSGSGHGIEISSGGGTSNHAIISNNHVRSSPNTGIKFTGGSVSNALVTNNTIHGNDTGLDLGSSVDAFVAHNVLGQNTTADIVSSSATTPTLVNNEQWSKDGTVLSSLTSGTAQAGGATTITLESGSSTTSDLYTGSGIVITGGTGAGQARMITGYAGGTLIATISPAWVTNPDSTSTYELRGADAHVNYWQGSAPSSLNSGQVRSYTSGMGANVITGTALDASAGAEIADDVWNELVNTHTTPGSTGQALADVETDVAAILVDTGTTLPAAIPTAAAVADAVWLEAIADHSGTGGSTAEALANASAAGVTGARAITFNARDGVTAIPTTSISIYDSANSVLITRVTTDTNGDATANLDDATYTLRALKDGYVFSATQSMAVTADATVTVSGSAVTTGTPVSPDGCMVYGYLFAGTTLQSGIVVKMYQVVAPPQKSNSNIMTGKIFTTTTDANGYFETEMAQDTTIAVEIPEAGIKLRVDLPADTTYDLSEEIS